MCHYLWPPFLIGKCDWNFFSNSTNDSILLGLKVWYQFLFLLKCTEPYSIVVYIQIHPSLKNFKVLWGLFSVIIGAHARHFKFVRKRNLYHYQVKVNFIKTIKSRIYPCSTYDVLLANVLSWIELALYQALRWSFKPGKIEDIWMEPII